MFFLDLPYRSCMHCFFSRVVLVFRSCPAVWPYLPDNTVEKYLTHAVPALRFPAEDAALIARTVGGHMGNIVECIIDTPRYGLRSALPISALFEHACVFTLACS